MPSFNLVPFRPHSPSAPVRGAELSQTSETAPLLVFSHLRWEAILGYEQRLLARFSLERKIYFFEDPVFEPVFFPCLRVHQPQEGITVLQAQLPKGIPLSQIALHLRSLLDQFLEDEGIADFTAWYFTPLALRYTHHLRSRKLIYDFTFDSFHAAVDARDLSLIESEMLRRADLVFVNGYSLFQAKRRQHRRIYPRPMGLDVAHFKQARIPQPDPADQAALPFPRIGFSGSLNDAVDLALLEKLALSKPDWHFILTGPAQDLVAYGLAFLPNVHCLGAKSSDELPKYMAGWDLALLPFKVNESTQFMNPGETLECLAAGLPVVSTALPDIVRPYGDLHLVSIGTGVEELIAAAEKILHNPRDEERLKKVDLFLGGISWDEIWSLLEGLETGLRPAPH